MFSHRNDTKLKATARATEGRYIQRKQQWRMASEDFDYVTFKSKGLNFRFPMLRHRFHWLLHNIPVHILIGLFPCKLTFKIHDWSSDRLNAVHHTDTLPPFRM